MKNHFGLGFVLVALVFSSGCKSIVPWPADRQSDGSYAGLRDRWRETTTEQGTLRIIMVHGMGGLGPDLPGYGDRFASGIASAFHVTKVTDVTNDIVVTNLPISGASTSITNFLRIETFNNEKNNHLTFYEVTWSPMTTPIKTKAFAPDVKLDKDRLFANKEIKGIIDQGFADAVLYLNPIYQKRMQEPIFRTLEQVRDASTNDADRIVFVTFSLGSKMTFDTISDNIDSPTVTDLEGKTTDIIMMANQVSLISLGITTNFDLGENTRVARTSLSKFVKRVQQQRGAKMGKRPAPPPSGSGTNYFTVNVVAATDPNDALSFPITPEDVGGESDTGATNGVRIAVANIYSHNTWLNNNWGFLQSSHWNQAPSICPVYWVTRADVPLVLESPMAHVDYDINHWLMRKLIYGIK